MIEINSTRARVAQHEMPRDAIGKPLWESPTLERYPGYEPLLREAVATAARGETFADRDQVRGARGSRPRTSTSTMQPVRGADGEIRYLLFEVRDITELKSAQEQLRQSQKMEALGQLTGGIAHDFNNLLTVVVGGLDLITKRTDDAKIRRYADNALSAAERGARLTAQLLAFSRVQRLEVRPTYVAPLIENMRHLLRNVLGPGIEKTLRPRRGNDPGDGRPDPARARRPQPRDQRPRRDARGRRPVLRNAQASASTAIPSSRTATISRLPSATPARA